MSQHEYADYGEPLDFEDKGMRLRIFKHGKRVKLQLDPLNRHIPITRPKGKNNDNDSNTRATDSVQRADGQGDS